jgi:hypothetical protein
VGYQPGNGTVEVELAKLQVFAVGAEDEINAQDKRISELEEVKNSLQGSIKVLIWMNTSMIVVLCAILGVALTWVSNHVTIRANFAPTGIQSETTPPQDSKVPYMTTVR